ncbi:peptidoglycan recognition protein family protein [Fluoribacter dumoffii]|nr:peptidoglycan recognition family protein [Fluoribacter dumoffii]MCW8416725.1 peptidoglycan recognition protein family protein [Fluoribacter dumoffii]MCW8455435.1 peptidoglycan recognition protein family protein [Fluoribacter dumoffii]MCW8460487.1 peptidoglycan recognition protein family protein [Fluoribacter dumoffii]MCW8483968.1 peptidoglycan recognition protein family protein [Fluoribacter dumoffii]
MKFFLFCSFFITSMAHAFSCDAPQKIHKAPIQFDAKRLALTRQYQLTHYGIDSPSIDIDPRMIILHWTCIPTFKATFRVFYPSTFPKNSPRIKELPGELNVSAHYLVDRDGSIYQLMPENWMARHAIGLNHYAIGIENVGGVNSEDDLTEAQSKANAFLVCYLKKKYPQIQYVIGHNEYLNFKNTPLWLERDPNYQTDKQDPGPDFLNRVMRLVQKSKNTPNWHQHSGTHIFELSSLRE